MLMYSFYYFTIVLTITSSNLIQSRVTYTNRDEVIFFLKSKRFIICLLSSNKIEAGVGEYRLGSAVGL